MARIVCVHGIGQQVAGEQSLLRDWTPALLDGLTRAGHGGAATADDVVMGFYGDLFRPAGERLAVGDPMFTADDVDPGLEEDLLTPAPRDGLGAWPGAEDLVWTNVADRGDVVALEKDLRLRFGPRVINALVHNGAHAHAVGAYLTDQLAGAAIAGGLRDQ